MRLVVKLIEENPVLNYVPLGNSVFDAKRVVVCVCVCLFDST